MGYINKWLRNLIKDMDENFTLPVDWNKYLSKVEQNHNLIIKSKYGYYCTNCNQTFSSNRKIGSEMKCPHCKHKFLIKSDKLKNWNYKDNILIIDKIQDQLIVRIFELYSEYDSKKQKFEHDTVEYARKLVYHEFRELRNERVAINQGGPYVYHYDKGGEWRLYDGCWYESIPAGFIYKNNLKEVLKNTVYEHSKMWNFIRNQYTEYYNAKKLLRIAKYHSFEVLIKLKLYNLAKYAEKFWTTGNFKSIFGVSKDYYEFMRKYNITYDELEKLKIYNTKDIKVLRFLNKFNSYDLERIKEYTKLDNFIKYFKENKLKDSTMYLDYLRFAKKLKLDLKNKKYLFPKNLKQAHDDLERQIEIMEQQINNEMILERIKTLSKNIYKNKKFKIFPADSVESLLDESQQQNNCVRTYVDRYAEGECDIYFMRKLDNPEKSLVTVEVRENKVVQKRTKNNDITTEEQDIFLKKWEETVLNKKINYADERILEYAVG